MTRGARFDFLTCDGGKAGHHRVCLEVRLLLGDRQHAANVLGRRRDLQRFEARKDVCCQAVRVLDLSWHQPHDLRAHCVPIDRQRAWRRDRTSGQDDGRDGERQGTRSQGEHQGTRTQGERHSATRILGPPAKRMSCWAISDDDPPPCRATSPR